MIAAEWMAGCQLARVEALALLRDIAGLSHASLLAHPDTLLGTDAVERLQDAARRLHAGEPLAYVLGWREFYGLRFAVSPVVLVPRPETEMLVDFALQHMAPQGSARVLDLGTGSGAIALTVAHERPHAQVWAVDASKEALAVAAQNAQTLLPRDRAGGAPRLVAGDWFAALPAQMPRFDIILSNPPYVATGDVHLEGLRYEPLLALVGRAGSDGLAEIRRIVAGAPGYLAAGGWLAIEHGYDQAQAVRAMLCAAGLTAVGTQPDLAGIPRMTFGQRAGESR